MSVLELARSGAAEDLVTELRAQADRSLYYFNKVVLGYAQNVDHLHLPMCQHLQETRAIRQRGYLLPRGHFKSTNISKGYPLWRLTQDSNTRILIVGESGPVAAKALKDIKWHILNNELFQALYPELVPEDVNKTKWTDDEILLPRSQSFDESSIKTIGIGAKYTGFHHDLIIFDDPIGLVAAQSPPEMQQAIDWFKAAPGLLHDPELSEELMVGTRWCYGAQDLYGWEMENMGTYEWYTRSAIENGEPIFPERFTLDTLERIRKREGDYLFSCQYLNDPIPSGGGKLDISYLREYKQSEDGTSILVT